MNHFITIKNFISNIYSVTNFKIMRDSFIFHNKISQKTEKNRRNSLDRTGNPKAIIAVPVVRNAPVPESCAATK